MSESKDIESVETESLILKDEIKSEITPIIENSELSSEAKVECIVKTVMHQESYSGPLPHPAALERYNKIIPNGADRIMTLTERQSAHRIKMESYVIPDMQKQSKTGQWFAFILCFMLIMVGAFLIYKDQFLFGVILLTVTLIGIASLFIKGKNTLSKDMENK